LEFVRRPPQREWIASDALKAPVLIARHAFGEGFEMNRLSIISDSIYRAETLDSQLQGVFETKLIPLDEIPDSEPTQFTVCDVNLYSSHIPALKLWLKRRPKNGKIILAVDKGSRFQAVQASAIGATDLLPRPIEGKSLLKELLGDIDSLAAGPTIAASPGVSAGVTALQTIFASASLGAPLDPKSIDVAGETIVSNIGEGGFGRWIDIVRKHHSQTYQHCLIVTGVAVAFSQHLGFSGADQQRMATAGLLHDIGKARIPLSILEKPGPLDADELAVMRQHPLFGYEALRKMQGLQPEMLDMVVHHHEYLDGSGYPHGLQANKLSDLVRTMTIADIFGALIERRSYKPPMSGEAAYKILKDMGPKLDADLVREFQPISRAHF
jgi:putative nucleotidyltransferase with HDIG domain